MTYRRTPSLRIHVVQPGRTQWAHAPGHLARTVAQLRRRQGVRRTACDPAQGFRPGRHSFRPGQQLRSPARERRDELRAAPARGLRPLPRRARHRHQGGLPHVGGPVRRVGLAQVPRRESRPVAATHGTRVRRHLLQPPPGPRTPLEETMGALDHAVRSGKALYAGISSYPPQQTLEAARILEDLGTPLLIHQPRYSMADRWTEKGSPNLFQALDEVGAGSIVFSPLAQGLPRTATSPGSQKALVRRRRTSSPPRPSPRAGSPWCGRSTRSPTDAARRSPRWRSRGYSDPRPRGRHR